MNEAARALVARMEEVYATPEWRAVWEARSLLCGAWLGPQWEVEFLALKAALANGHE